MTTEGWRADRDLWSRLSCLRPVAGARPGVVPPGSSHGPSRRSALDQPTSRITWSPTGSRRAAGILLHPTSLPGESGIGDLGAGARAFLTWARAAGQGVWQILPLGPTSSYHSPYDCLSAFAGNPLLISLTELVEEGFLPPSALRTPPAFPTNVVDFASVVPWKTALLRRSWQHFKRHASPLARVELEGFLNDPAQQTWLEDWALFSALRSRDQRPWSTWDPELRRREPQALAAARRALEDEVGFHGYLQFLFFRQWQRLRARAVEGGITILGDVPIYVGLDSSDVWSHQHLFTLDEDGQAETVAGVPPDYFSATGQRWGNPLYRWDRLEQEGFSWWIERLRAALRVADVVRIDHFRGFAGYWEIPASEPTAVNGRWVEGPGARLFQAIRATLGELPIVAEDLGVITPDVTELRRGLALPGMKVMQFGFGEVDGDHLPHRFTTDTVAYTGTHDNDTTQGWFAAAPAQVRARALDYLGIDAANVHWGMIRAISTSVASLAVVPVQDVLGLGSEARMNTPGVADGNWRWRVTHEQLRPEHGQRLARLATLTGRTRR